MALKDYRHLPTVKRDAHGKTKTYVNLARFNSECSKRGLGGNLCELTNLRCLKDGSGLATVKTRPGFLRARASGTWRLHFASCSILKRHLKGRVTEAPGLKVSLGHSRKQGGR